MLNSAVGGGPHPGRAVGRRVRLRRAFDAHLLPADCPSRRPRREGVRFLAPPDSAAAAGFRACRRCKPDTASVPSSIADVRRACAVIAGANGKVTLETLARRIGMNPHHLRVYERAPSALGITPAAYARGGKAEVESITRHRSRIPQSRFC